MDGRLDSRSLMMMSTRRREEIYLESGIQNQAHRGMRAAGATCCRTTSASMTQF
ncbi:unnamed protein product [Mycena citricolor]|uniref:Uncharacterized protein n=1 Tax=Mycena citricolor TaxID=2018698 RepID=A0AAD2K7P0_9AGAR|nr:unnamed protein product [Mycena citricolor]CAK5283508.1 unnamed protein product [Mycena citricolor]